MNPLTVIAIIRELVSLVVYVKKTFKKKKAKPVKKPEPSRESQE